VPVIKKAWFGDLIETDLPERIAFAFLDGDLYESMRDSLQLVEGRMAEGGVIIVHDYNNPALPGVARAVDEWLVGRELKKEVFQSMVILRKMVVV
jgi:O-methyltransferase